MNNVVEDVDLTILYQQKKDEQGLCDVKFLHKNLDEGSPAQVQDDLLRIQKAIRSGKVEKLSLGIVSLKKVG